jgi:hypothetical protein
MSADPHDPADAARVLRLAFAVPVAALLAYALRLPLAYIASVLVLTALGGLVAALSLRMAALMLVLVAVVATGLSLVLSPLLGNTASYLIVVAALLFAAYRAQGSKLNPLAALAIPLIVLYGPLVPLASGFAGGLALLLIALTGCAVVAVILAWVCFPGPRQAVLPPVVVPRSGADCAISAAIMTGLIALTLRLDAQSALRLLMIASGVLAVSEPGATARAAAATLAATVLGVAAVLVLRNIAFIAATPALSGLALAMLILIAGYRLVRPATAPVATTGLMTVLVLMGAGGDVPDSKLVLFLGYTLAGIAIAIGLRHTLLWHFGGRAYRAAVPVTG